MNIHSLFTKITLIFLVAIFLLIGLFLFYIQYEKEQVYINVSAYHQTLSEHFKRNRMTRFEIMEYVQPLNFQQANPREILHKSRFLDAKGPYEVLLYDGFYYLHIRTPFFNLLLKDLNAYEYDKKGAIFFVLFLGILILIYWWLIQSLKPLKKLRSSINQFAQGNLSVSCKSTNKDEIAHVANEFDHAARKIQRLLASRQLFLRTIMHELKTPIAKGRIVSELVSDQKQKKRMGKIFSRLDFLINDFAKMERLLSNNYELSWQKCTLDTVFDQAITMLLIETPHICLDINENQSFKADMELMAMVFKNLMDNALKYSYSKRVYVKAEKDALLFISDGEALQKPLEEYFEPFHRDTHKKNHGMGLGLYLVHSILTLHGMQLQYDYLEEQNIFKIIYHRS
jgi:two-component system OmpR family sensor kinase